VNQSFCDHSIEILHKNFQGWIHWGGGRGQGGGLFFMIKQKIIRDKMRYSNLSNNMMISELRTTITIQIQ
jgi:hypothetical protein